MDHHAGPSTSGSCNPTLGNVLPAAQRSPALVFLERLLECCRVVHHKLYLIDKRAAWYGGGRGGWGWAIVAKERLDRRRHEAGEGWKSRVLPHTHDCSNSILPRRARLYSGRMHGNSVVQTHWGWQKGVWRVGLDHWISSLALPLLLSTGGVGNHAALPVALVPCTPATPWQMPTVPYRFM